MPIRSNLDLMSRIIIDLLNMIFGIIIKRGSKIFIEILIYGETVIWPILFKFNSISVEIFLLSKNETRPKQPKGPSC